MFIIRLCPEGRLILQQKARHVRVVLDAFVPLAVRGDGYVYHNNAIWPWRIAAGGEVTNANS